jgi:hypothetical protein
MGAWDGMGVQDGMELGSGWERGMGMGWGWTGNRIILCMVLMDYNGNSFFLFNCHKLRKIHLSISYRIQ